MALIRAVIQVEKLRTDYIRGRSGGVRHVRHAGNQSVNEMEGMRARSCVSPAVG